MLDQDDEDDEDDERKDVGVCKSLLLIAFC